MQAASGPRLQSDPGCPAQSAVAPPAAFAFVFSLATAVTSVRSTLHKVGCLVLLLLGLLLLGPLYQIQQPYRHVFELVEVVAASQRSQGGWSSTAGIPGGKAWIALDLGTCLCPSGSRVLARHGTSTTARLVFQTTGKEAGSQVRPVEEAKHGHACSSASACRCLR